MDYILNELTTDFIAELSPWGCEMVKQYDRRLTTQVLHRRIRKMRLGSYEGYPEVRGGFVQDMFAFWIEYGKQPSNKVWQSQFCSRTASLQALDPKWRVGRAAPDGKARNRALHVRSGHGSTPSGIFTFDPDLIGFTKHRGIQKSMPLIDLASESSIGGQIDICREFVRRAISELDETDLLDETKKLCP